MGTSHRFAAYGLAILAAQAGLCQIVSIQLSYPPAELRAGIEGVAGFEVQLSKEGRVTGCKITQSTGNADLDRETCTQLCASAQFKPAIDQGGHLIRSTYASRIRWTIPHEAPQVAPTN